MKRLLRATPNLICLLLCTGSIVNCRSELQRHPYRYLIPEGYVGWVKIQYEVSDAPPLTLDDGFYVCNIPPDGLIKTSSSVEEGWAKDEYLYVAGDHSYPLPDTISGDGGLIWGKGYSKTFDNRDKVTEMYEHFFVGTEAEYENAVLQRRDKR